MKNDSFYEALGMQAQAAENAVPEMPEHKFSRKYKYKKKLLIKAYESSQTQNESVAGTFQKLSFRRKIQIAVLIAALALFLTGGSVYVAYSIGGFEGYRQSTNTEMSFVNYEGACETLYPKYYLTYDMSGYDRKVLTDSEDVYSEIYTRGDAFVKFTSTKSELYMNEHPDFNYEELSDSLESPVETDKHLHRTLPDGSELIIWSDWYTTFELEFSGISYDEGYDIYRSAYCKTYRVTYDMSDWKEEVMTDSSIFRWVVYKKGDDEFSFEIFTKESYQKVHLNTEGTELESRVVNGHEGIYINNPEKGFQYLAYDNGDYIFAFIFTFDYDKAMEIIDSIKLL